MPSGHSDRGRLGPWAAAIAISVALILQALFFGDGVLAIFATA